ncbi:MAG: carbon-nitrogen hydrolase family protein [Campylobacterales bacterium]|nr:carbon-nitrogen hydrolase family protein [Campylobacterales bacterium]
MKITTLQTKISPNYQKNLDLILKNYKQNIDSDFILAPEVSLTGFDYENFEKAGEFSKYATETFSKEIGKTPFAITMIEKKGNDFFNTAKVFHKNKIIHQQSKYKLFLLGNEDKYFKSGTKDQIQKFQINDVTYGILICFELRFTELWKELEGVDIILIPAAWGKLRKTHFEKLANGLAIANRCFVVLSDLSNDDMAKSSGIISPFGEFFKDDRKSVISKEIVLQEIKKMKKFIPYQ